MLNSILSLFKKSEKFNVATHHGYSKLQFLLIQALKDKNLNEIHKDYFDDGLGIGILSRYVGGITHPYPIIEEQLMKRIPEKYHKEWESYVNSKHVGW